jgi:hypothetical protein
MMASSLRITFFITLFALSFPFFSFAQIEYNIPKFEQQLDAIVTPLFPKPNERVNIRIWSGFFDTDTALFSWSIDGKVALQGRGENELDFVMKDLGQITTITLFIEPDGGVGFSKTYQFASADVPLVFDAQTYTPPFYKGRALLAEKASYKVVATPRVPDGRGGTIPKDELIYSWKRNGNFAGLKSGLGKYVFSVNGDDLEYEEKIEIEIKNKAGTSYARNTLILYPKRPVLYFYEVHPLFGALYSKELSNLKNYVLTNKEINITAEPFFFPIESGKIIPNTFFTWKSNGIAVTSGIGQNTVTFRNEGKNGTALIETKAQSPTSIFHDTFARLSLRFNE